MSRIDADNPTRVRFVVLGWACALAIVTYMHRVGFSAIGMMVRLVGPGGASTTAQSRENVGPPYSARVRVPTGGIRMVRFGIAGSNGYSFFPLK